VHLIDLLDTPLLARIDHGPDSRRGGSPWPPRPPRHGQAPLEHLSPPFFLFWPSYDAAMLIDSFF
jgi:hypothetical protein